MVNKRIQEFKRKLILESAFELFSERGFDEVTMDDIAEQSELSKATLYAYFESKNDILFSVLCHALETHCDEIKAIVDQGSNSLAALEQIVNKNYWDFRQAAELIHSMAHLKNIHTISPAWREEMVRLFNRKINILAELLSKCMEDGYLLHQDPLVLSNVIDCAIRGMCMPRLNQQLPDRDEELTVLRSLIFSGIKAFREEEIG